MRAVATIGIGAVLSGCATSEPAWLNLSFSSYASTPVVLTGYRLNGQTPAMPPVPDLVAGIPDVEWPRVGNGLYSLVYPRGEDPEVLAIELEWVELLSGRAWRVEAHVPIASLSGEAGQRADIMPIFGPDGLVVISSDPVPTTTGPEPVVDVLRLCGTRVPEADQADTRVFDEVIGVVDWKAWWRSPEAIRSASTRSECTAADDSPHPGSDDHPDPVSTERLQ